MDKHLAIVFDIGYATSSCLAIELSCLSDAHVRRNWGTVMRRRMLYYLLVAAVLVSALPTFADTLLASRFGVYPTVDYVNWEYEPGQFYSAYQFDLDSLKPTKNTDTVDYQLDDWFGRWTPEIGVGVYDYPGTGTRPEGEEPYDTEAYYFDDDSDNLYFATIVGFYSPENGPWREERYKDNVVVQGDFAIDLGLSGSQTDEWGFNYNYGVDLTPEIRPPTPGLNVTKFHQYGILGNGVYETTDGWYLGTPIGAVNPIQPGNPSDAHTNFDPAWNNGAGMTYVGDATVSWYQLQLYYDGNSVLENNWATWVIEVTIPRVLLPELSPGDELQFRWQPGCRNDGTDAHAFITGHGTVDTPEPSSLALFALGAGPLGMWLRRRRQQAQQPAA